MTGESVNRLIRSARRTPGRATPEEEEMRAKLLEADPLGHNQEPDPGHGGMGSADAGARGETPREPTSMNELLRERHMERGGGRR